MEDWTCVSLVEWMATVNLSRYVEVFRKNSVSGKEVPGLSDTKLQKVRTPTDCVLNARVLFVIFRQCEFVCLMETICVFVGVLLTVCVRISSGFLIRHSVKGAGLWSKVSTHLS